MRDATLICFDRDRLFAAAKQDATVNHLDMRRSAVGPLDFKARTEHPHLIVPQGVHNQRCARILGGYVPRAAAHAHTVARIFAAQRYGGKEPSDEDLIELKETWKGVRGGLVGRAFRRLIPLGASPQT